MPSTYTSNNKIQKIATGEQSGTWGNTTNTNFDLFDTAIDGFVSITLSGTTHTLNIPDGSAGDGRNKVLVFTGTLAATNTVSVTPNTVKKHYYVQNNTTGGQNIVISQGSGSSVTIKPGYSSIVYLDGAGSGAAVKEVLTSLKLTALLEATGAVLNGSSSGSTTLQASATASGTLTLPAATDTLVGKATTDTFTNKTFDTAGTGNVLRINGTQVSAVTGTGSVVLATSPTLVTPLLGTPTSGTLTNCTGLPVSTGISGLGANVATFLATPSSANLAGAVTDETGTGALVFANTPTLVTPLLGTPTSGTLTNCTGLPISTGVSGLGSGVATFLATPSSANLASAVTDETGTGALVFATGPVLTSPSLVTANIGTPALGTLTNCTGLPVSTGISGLGSGVATFLATPSSANLAAAVTDETGTGALVFGTSPTIATPTITTSATVPLVIGGTGTTSTLTLRSTSGVGTTGADIVFQTGNNGATEVMRLQNSGNVGIGTSSPSTYGLLTVSGGSATISPVLTIESTAFNSGQGCALAFARNGFTQPIQARIRTADNGASASNLLFETKADGTAGALSERMRIDSSGNVGIGTSSPAQKLDVVGNLLLSGQSTAEQYIKVGYGRSGNGYSYIDLVGDTTYAPGTRLIRGNTGANAISSLEHRGTGDLRIVNYEAAPICFYTSSSEKVRIDSSGNVGIGTSSPGVILDVGNGAGARKVRANGGNTSTDDGSFFLVANGGTSTAALGNYSAIIGGAYNSDTLLWSANVLRFVTNGSANERMRIDSSGNVGIGTTSVTALRNLNLDITAQGANDGAAVIVNKKGSGISTLRLATQGGASGFDLNFNFPTSGYFGIFDISASSNRLVIDTSGNVGIGTTSPAAPLDTSGTIRALSKTFAAPASGKGLEIYYSGGADTSVLLSFDRGSSAYKPIIYDASYQVFNISGSEKMRLDSNGYLLIGYTTSNGAYLLQVNSQIFATNATIATSDGRYKENISSIKSGLDVVGKLNPVSFTWKQHEIHNFDSGTQVGFIAQDVQEALADEPYLESVVKRNEVELKDGTKEEFYGLSDAKLIPILVKAIQELKAEIDILKARN